MPEGEATMAKERRHTPRITGMTAGQSKDPRLEDVGDDSETSETHTIADPDNTIHTTPEGLGQCQLNSTSS